jgi:hypothetical protein
MHSFLQKSAAACSGGRAAHLRRPLNPTGDGDHERQPRVVTPPNSPAKLKYMDSKVAREAERSLVEATQRLSPEERLNAYLEHCRLMMELYEAGQRMRSESPPPRASR